MSPRLSWGTGHRARKSCVGMLDMSSRYLERFLRVLTCLGRLVKTWCYQEFAFRRFSHGVVCQEGKKVETTP